MKTESNLDVALLLIRVGLALVFLAHGWDKFSNMEGTVMYFSSIGLSAFWAYFVATIEVAGALAMLLGVWTGWTGIILGVNMLAAMVFAKTGKSFIGGYELEVTLFLSAIAISLAGAGKYTIGRLFKKA